MNTNSIAQRRQGFSHIKKDIVCQDYARAVELKDRGITILALSDGHGSPKYFRSDRGAKFAVDTAIDAVVEFVMEFTPDKYLPEIHGTIRQGTLGEYPDPVSKEAEDLFRHLGRAIIYIWHRKVMEDWATDSPTPEETGKLSPDDQKYYKDENTIKERIPKAYGCTLQVAVLAPDYWFALHLGDGKIVAAKRNGEIYEPVIWDQQCHGTTTTSLCETSPEDLRYTYGRDREEVSALFLASDGTDDSFADSKELASFYGINILRDIYKNGWEAFEAKLPKLLDYLSRTRSGDDMSMSLWVDMDALSGMMPKIFADDIRRVEDSIKMYDSALEKAKSEILLYQAKEQPIRDQLKNAESDRGLFARIREMLAQKLAERGYKAIDDVTERVDKDKASEMGSLNAELNKISVETNLRQKKIDKYEESLRRLYAELDRLRTDQEALADSDKKAAVGPDLTPEVNTETAAESDTDTPAGEPASADPNESVEKKAETRPEPTTQGAPTSENPVDEPVADTNNDDTAEHTEH